MTIKPCDNWLLIFSLFALFWAANGSAETSLNTHLQNQGYLTFDMKKLPSGHDSIQATINGIAGVFIVDSGAQTTVLHQARINKYHIDKSELTDVEQSFAAGGAGQLSQYPLTSLAIDSQVFAPAKHVGIDTKL